MSRTAKWIIGILIVVLFACAVVSVGVIFFSRFNNHAWMMDFDFQRGARPDQIQPWDDMPMHPNRAFPGRILPGMLPFGGTFAGLICLGFLFTIALGVIALVVALTRAKTPAPAAVTAAPSAPLPAAPEPDVPARACPSCQRPVNDDWSHCPYCGSPLTPAE